MEELASALRRFYDSVNQPEKNVAELASEWCGREKELWEAMATKYGKERVWQSRSGFASSTKKMGFSLDPPAGGFSESAAKTKPVADGASGFSGGGVPSDDDASLRLHCEVIAEILCTLALGGNDISTSLRDRETKMSTTTHEAICALRVLQNVSDASKAHLQRHGGLCAVVEACAPTASAVAEAGAARSTLTIFILVDRKLATFARRQLGVAPPTTTVVATLPDALRKTKAWRSAVVKASDSLDAAVEAEIELLRGFVARPDAEALRDRLARYAAAATTPQVYGRQTVIRLLKTAVEACGDSFELRKTASALPGLSQADRAAFLAEKVRPVRDEDFDFSSDDDDEMNPSPSSKKRRRLRQKKSPPPPAKRKKKTVKKPPPEKAVWFAEDNAQTVKRRRSQDADEMIRAAETRGRGSPNWRQAQSLVLAKRMDRAIWDAFRFRDFDALVSLLDQGASANYARLSRETALMAAAFGGRDDVCRRLLALGADPAAQDSHGNSAATLARTQGHTTLASLLHGLALQSSSSSRGPGGSGVNNNVPASSRHGGASPGVGGGAVATTTTSKRRRGDDAFPVTSQAGEEDIAHQTALDAASSSGGAAGTNGEAVPPPSSSSMVRASGLSDAAPPPPPSKVVGGFSSSSPY